MKKQILFLVGILGLMPFDLVGQQKFNDLTKNQLFGPVKDVTFERKVYGTDIGYTNAKRTTNFDNCGYIVRSGENTYKYNEVYTQCNCHIFSGETTEEYYTLNIKELNQECMSNGKYTQKFQNGEGGEWITNSGEIENSIIFKFDASNRLLSLKQDDMMGGNLFKLLDDWCFIRTYSYRESEKLPYKVAEELDCGGDGWIYNLLIKYVNIDLKGNWTHRKIYIEESNKLLLEETRTITYYPETNSFSSIQPVPQQNKAPRFPGGESAMVKFFTDNANPRKPAIATAGYGEVIVEFTVTEEGIIENAKWKGRVSVSMDQEALRLVNMMPKWNPGFVDGQPAKMKVQVGLRFFPNQAFRYIKAMLY